MTTLHVEIPARAMEEIQHLRYELRSFRIPRPEFEERFKSIISRYATRLPMLHEQMVISVARTQPVQGGIS